MQVLNHAAKLNFCEMRHIRSLYVEKMAGATKNTVTVFTSQVEMHINCLYAFQNGL